MIKDETIAIQGDLRFVSINKLPSGVKKREGGVLVYGEVTGHSHRVREGDVYELGDRLFLQTYTPTYIDHEEHTPIPLEVPGVYEIKRQREYTNENATRLVID